MTSQFRLRHAALVAALAAAYPGFALGAGAARVEFANGRVIAQAPGAATRDLAKGAEVFPGETVVTNEGIAQMRFTDGARVSLKPGSEFRIDEYRFNGQPDGEEKGFFSLLKGGLRTITGLVGRNDRSRYQVRTTTATIGVRGTEYSVTYGNSINVNTGEGVVEVCNTAGCLLLYPGDEGYVAATTSPPALIQVGSGRASREGSVPITPSFEAPANDRDASGRPLLSDKSTLNDKSTLIGNTVVVASSAIPSFASVQETIITGTLETSGALGDFQVSAGSWSPGAGGSAALAGSDGIVSWGHWAAGSSGFVVNGLTQQGAAGDLLHYVTGAPTPSSDPTLPTAVVMTYSLLGGSASAGSTLGTVDSGSMQVSIVSGTAQVDSFSLGITAGNSYTVQGISPILINNAAGANLTFSGSGTATGCFSGCSTATVSGAFFGAGASRAGLSFGFSDLLSGSKVTGAAALSRTATTPVGQF